MMEANNEVGASLFETKVDTDFQVKALFYISVSLSIKFRPLPHYSDRIKCIPTYVLTGFPLSMSDISSRSELLWASILSLFIFIT